MAIISAIKRLTIGAVGPVSVRASVNQPQFVVQVASNRVELDEFNRWAAPLNDGIARAVTGDLVVFARYAGRGDVADGELLPGVFGRD